MYHAHKLCPGYSLILCNGPIALCRICGQSMISLLNWYLFLCVPQKTFMKILWNLSTLINVHFKIQTIWNGTLKRSRQNIYSVYSPDSKILHSSKYFSIIFINQETFQLHTVTLTRSKEILHCDIYAGTKRKTNVFCDSHPLSPSWN